MARTASHTASIGALPVILAIAVVTRGCQLYREPRADPSLTSTAGPATVVTPLAATDAATAAAVGTTATFAATVTFATFATFAATAATTTAGTAPAIRAAVAPHTTTAATGSLPAAGHAARGPAADAAVLRHDGRLP